MSVHPLAADGYPVGPALRRGLTLLLKAKSLAADVGRDVWDFAVEADRLRAEGLTECDLRWLTCRGLVEHAREADPLSPRRWFAGPGGLNFPPATCFVLTDLGEAFAAEYQRPAGAAGPTPSAQSTAALLPIMVDLGNRAGPARKAAGNGPDLARPAGLGRLPPRTPRRRPAHQTVPRPGPRAGTDPDGVRGRGLAPADRRPVAGQPRRGAEAAAAGGRS